MRFLVVVLVLTVALGAGFVVLAATDSIPFVGQADDAPSVTESTAVDEFDADAAFGFLERQVELGPRPAGSAASRKLAGWLRERLPAGRFQPVPGDFATLSARYQAAIQAA